MKLKSNNFYSLPLRGLISVLTAVGLIFLSGAYIVVSLPQTSTSSTPDKIDQPLECCLFAGVTWPSEGGGSMTKSDLPHSPRTFILTVPAVAPPTNNFDHFRPITNVIELKTALISDRHDADIISAAGSFSPWKTREFTLVAARPMGTS